MALDTRNRDIIMALVEQLAPAVGAFKVGFFPFLLFGWELVEFIHSKGGRVFLDLKLHDIPNTVANAVEEVARTGVFMLTLHILGGREMMEEAVQRVQDCPSRPLLLGVTLLTSMNTQDLRMVGIKGPLEERVLKLAHLARDSGLDGVVASPLETLSIRKALGKGFIIVTPGVRPPGSSPHEQKRVATPREAIMAGAHYIVVGRPICEAKDPLAVVQDILKEVETQ